AMTSNRKNTDRHTRKAPSSNKGKNKSKEKGKDTPVHANAEKRLHFCVEGMKTYFIKYRDGRLFTLEKSLNLSGLGNEFPKINRQFA
ncbi:hypothetical protein HAX54_036336, partial [Datura stramonium]|nr:hypothetical protein [Datura stramonium]